MRYNVVQLVKEAVRRFASLKGRTRPVHKARPSVRLGLENLEDRCCPSGLHLTAQTLNLVEGQSSMMGPMVLATLSDADGNASPTSFTASVDYGDGSGPSTAFVTNWYGPLEVVGSHAYPEEGTYNLTLTVTDADGDQAVLQEPAVVADAPLSASMNMPVYAAAGQPINQVVASFTDANYNGTAADFTASVNWGDGPANTVGTVSGGGGWGGASFFVNGSHTYAAGGTYTITVGVQDDGGSTLTTTNTAYVTAPPPAPVVSAVSPSHGPATGGSYVTISGSGFTDANGVSDVTGVSFGGVASQMYYAMGANTLYAYTPAHTVGVVDVTVTTAGGTSAVLEGDQFTYDLVTTTMDLTSSENPATYGDTVLLTARLSSTNGAPTTGTVTFEDGTTVLGTANVTPGPYGYGAQATFMTSALDVGNHTIVALFGGNLGFAASISAPLFLAVAPAENYWVCPAGGDHLWTTDTNWSRGTAPRRGQDIIFDDAHSSEVCNLPAGTVLPSLYEITFGDWSGTFNVNSDLTLQYLLLKPRTNVKAKEVVIATTIDVTKGLDLWGGSIYGGTLQVEGHIVVDASSAADKPTLGSALSVGSTDGTMSCMMEFSIVSMPLVVTANCNITVNPHSSLAFFNMAAQEQPDVTAISNGDSQAHSIILNGGELDRWNSCDCYVGMGLQLNGTGSKLLVAPEPNSESVGTRASGNFGQAWGFREFVRKPGKSTAIHGI